MRIRIILIDLKILLKGIYINRKGKVMKKTISIILVLFVLAGFCVLSFAEEAAEEKEIFTSGSFDYTIENNEAIIVKYNGASGNLQIPDEIDGYPVTAISDNAFPFNEKLISITIPDSITDISINLFENCWNLVDIIVSPDHPVLETIDGVLYRKTDKTLIAYPCALNNTDIYNSGWNCKYRQ